MNDETTVTHAGARPDADAPSVDAETLQRLRELKAKRAEERTASGWLPLVSSFSLAMFVVGVMFYVLPREPSLSAGMEQLDLLTAEEEFEFYQDLDFYAWLAQQDATGVEGSAAGEVAPAPDANAATRQPEGARP